MEDTKELEGVIRSLLVSNPKVTKANSLFRDFEETEGRCFPFRQLGFHSFIDYLRSIPHVVRLEPSNSYNPDVIPIVTKDISHIDQLVTKQRSTVPKRRKTFSRRGGFNGFGRGGPLPPRRRAAANIPQPRFMPTNYKGVHVSEIEKHIRGKYSNQQLSSNGIHSGQDLLYHTREMVDRVDQKVYPKLSYSPEIPTATKQQPEGQHLGVPAGMEEEYEDEFDEDYDEFYDEDDDDPDAIKYDEHGFDQNDEKALSDYTIQLCTEKLLNSKRYDHPATKGVEESRYALEEELTPEDHESTFSRVMIDNFRLILDKYPGGIWATQLKQKYQEEFKVSLDYVDLGYASAINMVSNLPNVFTYEREGHDWKLFDARLVRKVRTQTDCKTAIWADKYVPDSIYKNVINLVHQYPDGIKSTYFLSFYEREYHNKLNVEELGFKQLEEFLEYFKDKITVTRSVGHYLLLPKHTTRSLDNPPTPNEELQLPPNIEFLGPDNVLRPDDIIPMQQLPEIKVNSKDSSEPLILMEVRVAEVMTPSYFFLLLDSCYIALESMMEDLDKFYNQEERHYHILLLYMKENLFCACKYLNSWHRAKIIRVLPNNKAEIEYIDYGTPETVNQSQLRFLHSDFAKLPTQAICAKLLGITPVGGGTKWPKETCKEFLRIVEEKRLFAKVYHIGTKIRKEERPQISIVLHDTNSDPQNEIICNEYLVEKGFAEFICKGTQGTLEDSSHTLNQATSSASQLNPPPAQATEPKPTSSILPPPGFESLPSADGRSKDGQYHPQHTTFQQHYHHTNNFLFTPSTKSLQQFLLANPHLLNTQQINYQQPHFNDNWSNMPYLPNYPNYILPNNTSTGYLPPTNIYFPPPQALQNYSPQQAYNPLSINVNVHSFPNYNNSVPNTLARMPGYSGDLSVPLRAASRTPPSQQSPRPQQQSTACDLPDQFVQLQIIQNSFPPPKPLNTESSATLRLECDEPSPLELNHDCDEPSAVMLNLECDELSPLELKDECDEPSPVMLRHESDEPLLVMLRDDCDESTDSESVSNLIESVQKESNFELDNLEKKISNENILQSQMVPNQSLTNSSLSDNYLSDEDLSECHSVSPPGEQIQSSLVNEVNEPTNEISESWEDIDADDTPAKSENFSEDFSNLLVLKSVEVSPVKPNDESPNCFISETNKMNCDNKLLSTKSIENTVNWKDHFNPDSKNNIESNKKDIKITPRIEDNNFKRKLVERIDFKDKYFHIICVKNKYAVLAKEFYIQFVPLQFNVIEKVVPLRTNKDFPKICRKDYQELFSELDKITLYGETVKRDLGRIGFKPTSFPYSYVSDIPVVLSALQVKADTNLLNIIKEWELRATTT